MSGNDSHSPFYIFIDLSLHALYAFAARIHKVHRCRYRGSYMSAHVLVTLLDGVEEN